MMHTILILNTLLFTLLYAYKHNPNHTFNYVDARTPNHSPNYVDAHTPNLTSVYVDAHNPNPSDALTPNYVETHRPYHSDFALLIILLFLIYCCAHFKS